VLLDGPSPAYRTLSEGDTGPDVRQLNADLVALGYATRSQLDPTSDHFSSQTANALEKLQRKLAIESTGSLALGQAVFLPTPLRITNVIATLGTGQKTSGRTQPHAEFVGLTITDAATNAPATPNSDNPRKHHGCKRPTPKECKPHNQHPWKPPRQKECKPHKPKRHKPKRHHPHTPRRPMPGKSTKPTPSHKPGAGTRAPAPAHPGARRHGGGSARPRGAPANHGGASGNHGGGSGTPGASAAPPAQPIMLASSTRRDVVVRLDATEQPNVKAGDQALITLPDGRTTPGVVTQIGTVADSSGAGGSGSGSSTATIPVHLALEHPRAAPKLDQAPVQVQITTATLQHALAVPVTALVALTDGGYAVKTIQASAAPRLVPVTVGLVDDSGGLVQITSKKLAAGEKVLVPGTSPTTSRASLAPARIRHPAPAPALRV
jgi:hypothetical protein